MASGLQLGVSVAEASAYAGVRSGGSPSCWSRPCRALFDALHHGESSLSVALPLETWTAGTSREIRQGRGQAHSRRAR